MIEIENLNKFYNYKKTNEFQALHDVSLTIGDGELTAIIGRSGAGKTTLLHIIACIDRFESGSYKIDGEDISKFSDKQLSKIRNKKVGIVMQDFALIDSYSVLENVKTPLYFAKVRGSKAKKRAMEALAAVGMDEFAAKPAKNLSGGQKQRVAIARAIVNDPSFILADEPTGALDSKTSDEIMELFKSLNAKGRTVVIITHDPKVANACNRQIEILDGRIVTDTAVADTAVTDTAVADTAVADTAVTDTTSQLPKNDQKETDTGAKAQAETSPKDTKVRQDGEEKKPDEKPEKKSEKNSESKQTDSASGKETYKKENRKKKKS